MEDTGVKSLNPKTKEYFKPIYAGLPNESLPMFDYYMLHNDNLAIV